VRLLPDRAAKAVAALFSCLALTAGAEPPQTLTPMDEAKIAPDLALDIVDGGKLKLSDLRGKIVLVNFWATWCPPCKREMPSFERLKALMNAKTFEIVAINAGEDEEEIGRFRRSLEPPLTFRLALDPKADAIRAFSVAGLPATFVIDRRGRVVYRALGARRFDDAAIVSTIRSLEKN